MKKKLITTILISAMLIGTLSACGNSSQDSVETTAPAEIAEETDIQETDEKTGGEEGNEAEAVGEEGAEKFYEAGLEYLYNLNGQDDLEAAYTNFNQALELGNIEANCYLGLLCDWYNMPEKNYEKAKVYYEAAGENPYAQVLLGLLYCNGQGVEQDVTKAQELFDNAIEQGEAGGYLGKAVIACGEGDYAAALEYYEKVSGTDAIFVASALRGMGDLYYNGQGMGQSYEAALSYYQSAADIGNVSAMNSIGVSYQYGLGVEQDYAQAMEWYTKAADLGSDSAVANIGWLYANGLGVEQDYAQAMEWFTKAADLGSATAMFNIGYMYDIGLGVEQDSAQAVEWYTKAAELGDTDAMKELSIMYMEGRGVEQDFDIAQEWYDKAEEAK